MQIIEIIEARKNPEQNPKTSINSLIIKAVDSASGSVAGVKNAFVSLTNIDKLGINPQSEYETPLGIYAYPAEYVVQTAGEHEVLNSLPFAGSRPYVNVFSARGTIINVATISAAAVREYYKRIAELWAKESGKDWKTSVDDIESIINSASTRAKFSDVPGGQFWYVTMIAAERYFTLAWRTRREIAWNKLFREIGIDGVVDYVPGSDGMGIIHTSEPSQAVFFTKQTVTNVRRYSNKYSPEEMEHRKQHGSAEDQRIRSIVSATKAGSPEQVFRLLARVGFKYIKLVKDQATRSYIIEKQPVDALRNISHPTEEDQRVGLETNIDMLRHIQHPSESVLLSVLKKNPELEVNSHVISRQFPNASEPLQMIAVNSNVNSLKNFTKTYPSTVKAALDAYARQQRPEPVWLVHLAKTHGIALKRRLSAEVLDTQKEIEYLQSEQDRLSGEIAELELTWEQHKATIPPESQGAVKKAINEKIIELEGKLLTVQRRLVKSQALLGDFLGDNG